MQGDTESKALHVETLSYGGMGLSTLVMAAGLGLESLAGDPGPIALVRGIGMPVTRSRLMYYMQVIKK